MASNPFLDFAKETVPFARRRKLEKSKNVPTPQEKKQADQDKLHELRLDQFAKQKKKLLSGKYGHHAVMLCSKLEALHIDDGELLIEMAKIWQATDRDTRFLVLQLIDSAMVDLRLRHGFAPLDDPIFDEEPNAFLIIRGILS